MRACVLHPPGACVCVLHILRAVTLVFYHSFSSMTRQEGSFVSFDTPGSCVSEVFCLTSQHAVRVDMSVGLMVSRVHSVADFGLWGRGMDARGRLRGLEGDLSEF